jgi:hypothetical protein
MSAVVESQSEIGGWVTYTGRHAAYVDPLDKLSEELDEIEERIDRAVRAVEDRTQAPKTPIDRR